MRVLDHAWTQRVFGREREVDEVRRLLGSAPGVVTVTGRGGVMADRLPDLVTGLPSVDEMVDLTRALGLTFYEALLMVRRVYNAVRADDVEPRRGRAGGPTR